MTEAVARNLFKLMAIKDEYEVARLYTDGSFKQQLSHEFESYDRLEFHLAPPIMGRSNADGSPRKSRFPGWMMTAFECWRPCGGCAARCSIRSREPPSGVWSGNCSPL